MSDKAESPSTDSKPPASRRRGEAAKALFREELVRIALELFNREGSKGVSIRAIASAAGISPMAVYRYFPNRMTLLSQLWDDVFHELAAFMEEAVSARSRPEDRLLAVLDAHVAYWTTRPEQFRMIYVEPALDPEGESELDFWRTAPGPARVRGLMGSLLMDCWHSRSIQGADPAAAIEQLSIYLRGLLHTLLSTAGSDWLQPERALQGARSVVLALAAHHPSLQPADTVA
ncbi:TetR family transcriptional regulator [Sphaerotilus hippei]|uniref:TetR family transcriptional regulator n=1 Tax=Sphaerotilus hippei TaxID=744406 RepID=A0A318H420_9BURK|nr:TetR/AcrR family transcriptional regulator [Sphaerotilus hippei]PXW93690.1 TetR family transcriptional regulator [Sphaerotilus hippei]